jgi:hypothetical protein
MTLESCRSGVHRVRRLLPHYLVEVYFTCLLLGWRQLGRQAAHGRKHHPHERQSKDGDIHLRLGPRKRLPKPAVQCSAANGRGAFTDQQTHTQRRLIPQFRRMR